MKAEKIERNSCSLLSQTRNDHQTISLLDKIKSNVNNDQKVWSYEV